jgi:hypothetical protein
VTEVHVTVVRRVDPRTTVGVLSFPPKFMPCSVISLFPEFGELMPMRLLTMGLSKENQFESDVPTSKLIVTPTAL